MFRRSDNLLMDFTTHTNREPAMNTQRLVTIISLARNLAARKGIPLAASYLKAQGLSAHLAAHILARRPRTH